MSFINLGANLDEVTSEFPVAPAGTFPCQITSAKEDVSRESQQPVLIVQLTPTVPVECQVGKATKMVSGQALFKISVSLQPQALFTLKDLLVAAGVPFSPNGFDPDPLVGKMVNVRVSKEQDKTDPTRWFNKVKRFSAIG